MKAIKLCEPIAPAYRTQYAEVKDRILGADVLLPGTVGTLVEKEIAGQHYVYRRYHVAPGLRVDDLVGRADAATDIDEVKEQMNFAAWVQAQVRLLGLVGFQVQDKLTARVLIELHAQGLMAAGLSLVGTVAYAALLNEMGFRSVVLRTEDIDLARPAPLRVAGPVSLADTLRGTRLGFAEVPGMPSQMPPTAFKLPGSSGLRVELLTPGRDTGRVQAVADLEWHAQTVPHLDYLCEGSAMGMVLAGGHCVPARLPQPPRFVWHKLLSSRNRPAFFSEKMAKDVQQAATLAVALLETGDDALLIEAFEDAPEVIKAASRSRLPDLAKAMQGHPHVLDAIFDLLGGDGPVWHSRMRV